MVEVPGLYKGMLFSVDGLEFNIYEEKEQLSNPPGDMPSVVLEWLFSDAELTLNGIYGICS